MSRRSFLWGFAAIGLLSRSLLAADSPPSDPLRITREMLARPLPSRFTAKSKLSWPGGVVTDRYEYHGSPQRCIIRSSLLSVGRFQGAPHTVHVQRLVLYGGTWIDERLGVDPEIPSDHDGFVITTFRSQRENSPQSPPQTTAHASRSRIFEPRASLAGIGIAFGFQHQFVFPEFAAAHLEETTTLRPAREQIDGTETIVIQLASTTERRTLWLAPQHRMLPRQIEIEHIDSEVAPVGGAHRFAQDFWDDFPHGRRALYHQFRFEQIGGQPWITGFRAQFESDDQEGNACILKGEYDLKDLTVDAPPPTGEEPNATIAIPEKRVVEVELPDGQGRRSGIWNAGRVVQENAGGFGGGGFF